MSYAAWFDARWFSVIAPAIRGVAEAAGGTHLEPHRVDMRMAGDLVLTEIVQGIASCRFFLADITAIGELDGRPVRNANVLYEVGIVHAARLP